ncbi:MAG: BlaI/MecI/CopY family transcriptional regulator [Bacteroidota bacterium]
MLPKPTDGELAILRILWQQGASTVRTVNDALNLKRDVGYTTTLKIMQIMFEKGLLDREKAGKTHIYHPLIEEEEAQTQLLDKLMDTAFQGSAKKLIMRALGNRRSSQEELDEIRKYLDQISKENKD